MVREKQKFPISNPIPHSSPKTPQPSNSLHAVDNAVASWNRNTETEHRTVPRTDSETHIERTGTERSFSRKRKNENELIIDLDRTDDDFEQIVYSHKSRDDRSVLQETDRQRKARTRSVFSIDTLARMRTNNRLRKTENRLSMNEEQLISYREKDRLHTSQRRAHLDETELNILRENDREQTKQRREVNRTLNGPLYRKAAERTNIDFYSLSPFETECVHCKAIHFSEEKPPNSRGAANEFNSCCGNGKFAKVSSLSDEYPQELKVLYFAENENQKNFLANIRKYNNSFACASLACCRFNFPTPGPSCFKISGQVYHKFNTAAQPVDASNIPTNGQLYFLDSNEAQKTRLSTYTDLDPVLFAKIEVVLRKYYPFAEAYEMMKDIIAEYERMGDFDAVQDVRMLLSLKEGFDPNRYNVCRSNEVSAIIVGNAAGEIPAANIVVIPKGNKELKNVYPLDPIVEPMIYPLLYPTETKGWNFTIKDSCGKRLSLCDYTKYKLFYRPSLFIPHHYAGKLFQQWLVDQTARIEWNRLNFVRTHQKELRASNYKGLDDFLSNRAEQLGAELGKQVILPSSFMGGPRNKDQSYIDSLAIVGEMGKPDLFITYTINPNDPDIKKCLLEGQSVQDRPDIVARVFKVKSDKLIEEVTKDEIFGKVIGYCWVVEFQKRGLPHLHFLVTLDAKDKFKNKDEVDAYISAELPCKEKEPELRELVRKFMLHGPCGECRPEAPCMRNGKCRFKFPKKYREETQLGEDGYALNKRPNNGEFEYNKGVRLTNQFVAAYNPYLLLRFCSHINVEICSEIGAVKYLYKYIYKGFDAATVECVKEGPNGEQILLKYDEVGQYLDARYLSPVEACYRILKYDLQGKSHAVDRLEVHLENEQMVYFDQNATDENIEEAMQKDSKLLAYFKFFGDNPTAPKFKYTEMPTYCTFIAKERKWKWPRQGSHKVIGRMYTINPKNTELYYLRYLLLHVHATSFTDLKTINGKLYPTFAQACLARGLTRDDAEWDKCLEEASQFKFPRGLRSLFANILVNCDPKYPELLWEKHKDSLSYDLKRLYSVNVAYSKALFLINSCLLQQEKSLNDFKGMPNIPKNVFAVNEEEIFDPKEEAERAANKYNMMNKGQKNAYKAIKSVLVDGAPRNKCFYIDGPGGTGKSFVQTGIFHLSRSLKKNVCNMAFSGIAATLLKGGRTVHSRFKLPLDLEAHSSSGIENHSKSADEIKSIDLFIRDEAPMAPLYAIEIVDRKLREIHGKDEPFGGKIMILSGDNRQCLSIKRKATRSEIIDLCLKNSYLWQFFTKMRLIENMRKEPGAQKFADEILAVGDGTAGDYILLPSQCYIDENSNLADEIFGEIAEKRDFSKLCSHCILAPYNSEVDFYNEKVSSMFPGNYISFYSVDEAESKGSAPVLPELLNKLQTSSLPNHELKLKINCVTKLIRNLNVSSSLCNGTRLQILDVCNNVLRVMILTGDRAGEIEFIPRITLLEDKKFPYILKRHQYPLKLAFSMSIHGAQGQTFEKIGLDFSRDVFSHGQTYVSLSRARNWDKIRVKISKENKDKKIRNIVWSEAL